MARKNRHRLRKKAARRPSRMAGILESALQPSVQRQDLQPGSELQSTGVVDTWRRGLHQVREMFPDDFVAAVGSLDCYFEIEAVYADGFITGTCHGSDNYRIYVDLNGLPPAGCTCIVSRGEYPCEHGLRFIDFLLKQLSIRSSRFVRWLASGALTRTSPPAKSEFQSDLETYLADVLEDYLPVVELEPSNTDLPDVQEPTRQRIAWNFVSREPLSVEPILQAERKRRGGWTKGKKIQLKRLREHASCFSEADRTVCDSIDVVDSYYYSPKYNLDVLAALEHLVDQPNVLLDGKPATVRHFTPMLEFRANDEACWLTLAREDGIECIHTTTHFAAIDRANSVFSVCHLDQTRMNLIRGALSMPALPLAAQGQLVERAKQLQHAISIKLPESLAGKLEQDNPTPALLLRTRADGTLDYGLRIRDSHGHLHLPETGCQINTLESDGHPVQLARDFDAERRLARGTAGSLGLSEDEIHGSVGDFEDSIRLLEKAQELEPGLEVLWDRNSEKQIRVLGNVSSKNVQVGITQKRDWFQLSGDCKVGDQSVDISELLDSFNPDGMHGDYVRIGDKGWARVSEALRSQLQSMKEAVNRERGAIKFDATSAQVLRDVLNEDIVVNATRAWKDCLARLQSAEQLEPELPQGLNATLRDYQQEGFCWLRRLAEWGVGGILADDMGLGKTLQTLAVLLDRASDGPALVIAPTSVGFNWVRETERFAPELRPHLYRETDRSEFLNTVSEGDLVVCSYGLALRDAKQLAGVKWSTIVLDEAQAIKNSRSKTSAAIQKLSADWRIALTGTPMENHLGELWSIFRVISPGVFGGWEQFRKRYAAPIEKDNDDERKTALRDRIRPFVLRRTKQEVLDDLPPRTETNIYIEMEAGEREAYDRVRLSAIGELDQIAKLPEVQDQRFRMLALLTRLRQLACSPRLVHESWTNRSSKLKHLIETVHELAEEGHRVLIFSQFVEHLKLIREAIEEEGISFEYLDGSTPAKARQDKVDGFQAGNATVFLISLKAGGTGLNLTAADYVIHMDPWWNPAVEDQATDRAHRIGQDKPVMVYRFVAKDSIEEEILKLHESKRDLVSGVLEGSSTAAKLTTEDLAQLIRTGT